AQPHQAAQAGARRALRRGVAGGEGLRDRAVPEGHQFLGARVPAPERLIRRRPVAGTAPGSMPRGPAIAYSILPVAAAPATRLVPPALADRVSACGRVMMSPGGNVSGTMSGLSSVSRESGMPLCSAMESK